MVQTSNEGFNSPRFHITLGGLKTGFPFAIYKCNKVSKRNTMIKVIDNFVNPAYYEAIEDCLLYKCPWFWTPSITDGELKDEAATVFGFSHRIFNGKQESQFYHFLLPMFLQAKEEINAEAFLRARADMTVITLEQVTYEPHIDIPKTYGHINMIFYIGSSDGDTIIYKEKFLAKEPYIEPKLPKTLTEEQRVTPKANRVVIFSGEHWHTGQSPKEHSRRVLINSNFI